MAIVFYNNFQRLWFLDFMKKCRTCSHIFTSMEGILSVLKQINQSHILFWIYLCPRLQDFPAAEDIYYTITGVSLQIFNLKILCPYEFCLLSIQTIWYSIFSRTLSMKPCLIIYLFQGLHYRPRLDFLFKNCELLCF